MSTTTSTARTGSTEPVNPARGTPHAIARNPVAASAGHLYDAECALHAAHQSHVQAWITAAGDKLHRAVAEHLAAVAAQHDDDRPVRAGSSAATGQ